jgi:hypothetical protein
MSKKGFHFSSYITRIGFQADKAHPQMTFRALQKLTAAEAPIVLPMREDPMAYRITGENEVGKPKPAALTTQGGGQSTATSAGTATPTPTSAQSASPKPTTPQSAPQTTTTTSPSEPKVESKIEKMKRELAEAEAAEKVEALKAKPAEPEKVDTGLVGEIIAPATKPKPVDTGMVDTGFGLGAAQAVVEVAPSTGDAQPTTTNTVADTGPAEESDADLDARVASLLN